jgi:hypothetical protein
MAIYYTIARKVRVAPKPVGFFRRTLTGLKTYFSFMFYART